MDSKRVRKLAAEHLPSERLNLPGGTLKYNSTTKETPLKLTRTEDAKVKKT